METTKSKESFYKTRTVAGRLSAAFRFIKGNLSLFIKLGLYIILPLAILQSFFIVFLTPSTYTSGFGILYFVSLFIFLLITILGASCYRALIYSLLEKYTIDSFIPDYKNLKPLQTVITKNTIRLLIISIINILIVGILLFIPFMVRANLISFSVSIILLAFIIIPLCYLEIIYIFENKSLLETIKKAFKVGVKYWGGTFAILFLTGILAGIIQLIGILPLLLGINIAGMANQSLLLEEANNLPGYFPVFMYLLSVIGLIIYYFSQLIYIIPFAYQYGNIEAADIEIDQDKNDYRV